MFLIMMWWQSFTLARAGELDKMVEVLVKIVDDGSESIFGPFIFNQNEESATFNSTTNLFYGIGLNEEKNNFSRCCKTQIGYKFSIDKKGEMVEYKFFYRTLAEWQLQKVNDDVIFALPVFHKVDVEATVSVDLVLNKWVPFGGLKSLPFNNRNHAKMKGVEGMKVLMKIREGKGKGSVL